MAWACSPCAWRWSRWPARHFARRTTRPQPARRRRLPQGKRPTRAPRLSRSRPHPPLRPRQLSRRRRLARRRCFRLAPSSRARTRRRCRPRHHLPRSEHLTLPATLFSLVCLESSLPGSSALILQVVIFPLFAYNETSKTDENCSITNRPVEIYPESIVVSSGWRVRS